MLHLRILHLRFSLFFSFACFICLSNSRKNSTKTLDREILGFDENWRPVCTQPPPPKGKYDTISTYSTRASSRRSTATVAKNRVSAACKSKSSSVVVSQAPPSSTMQSNPTGRGGTRRKRSSLNSNRSNPTKRARATGEDDAYADHEANEPVLESAAKKTTDTALQAQPSPPASIEILDEGIVGGFIEDFHRQATSAAVTGGNSSMPPVSRSENKSGDSRLNYHLPLRTGGWIEDTPFKIPEAMKSWFGSFGGEPTDQFYPNIDLLCGESVATDSAKDGGDLGYRAFRDLITPADRPQGQIDAPAAQHFNDLYKAVQSSMDLYYVYRWNQMQLTQNNIDIAELKKRAEAAESALKINEKKLESASSNLEAANRRLEEVEPKLKAETERADGLTEELTDLNQSLPVVKKTAAKRAVDKLLQSDWFNDIITLRHNGGWCAAHRVVCHVKKLDEDGWQEFEAGYEEKELYKVATGFEPQELPEAVICNANQKTLPPLQVPEDAYWSGDEHVV
ncbi:uncharacterized protein [Spinacia oleracea]|uniref:Uncharacterized protein isoform X2 n=1 Tax=Spinacia oleracea TaxID=3562 RepID=A0ABM3RAW9_SPIOL|nr:uncharacterized protein LOC110796485 isoform X2 [Spinacia oleracea]